MIPIVPEEIELICEYAKCNKDYKCIITHTDYSSLHHLDKVRKEYFYITYWCWKNFGPEEELWETGKMGWKFKYEKDAKLFYKYWNYSFN